MSRSWNVGGRGPAAPARPLTRVVAYLAVASLVVVPVAVLHGSLVRVGLWLLVLVLCPLLALGPLMAAVAIVMLRRDGLASGLLLFLSSPIWVLLLLILGLVVHDRYGVYPAAAVLWVFVIVLPLPVEIRAQRRRAAALTRVA